VVEVIQTVALRSGKPRAGRFPPVPVGQLIVHFPHLVRQAISMRFRRKSTLRGHPPSWLLRASDVQLVSVSGNRDTEVRWDIPRLGDALGDAYAQGELWPSRPDPDDTGFDLIGDILTDIADNNEDSDRFDPALLKGLVGLRSVIGGEFRQALVSGRRYTGRGRAILDSQAISTAQSLYSKTPAAVRVRIVGALDEVKKSTQTFSLRLADGNEVRGVYSGGDFASVLRVFVSEEQVVVRGDALFRPSGQLLLVDAEDMSAAVGESAVWSRLPVPSGGRLDVPALHKRQTTRSGMAAIMGQWPGDESEEEVLEALRELS
jgi:hypothetical protein